MGRMETNPLDLSGFARGGPRVVVGLRSRAWRLILFSLPCLEILILSLRFESPRADSAGGRMAWLLAQSSISLRFGIAAVSSAALYLLLRRGRTASGAVADRPARGEARPVAYLLAHLAAFAAFLLVTGQVFEGRADARTSLWLAAWVGCGASMLVLWTLSLWTPAYLLGWLRQSWRGAAIGLGVGLAACAAGTVGSGYLWEMLREATLRSVHALIVLLHGTAKFDPAKALVGTESFGVLIAPQCSGYEGIGLIVVLLACYLWLFRRDHRFPQSLLMLPLGIALIWAANVLRIAALVEVGTYLSPDIAVGGFHSQAGWIAFVAIGLGLIAAGRRLPYFRKIEPVAAAEIPRSTVPDTAPAHLVPLMALVGMMMGTQALTEEGGFDRLYPLRIVAVAAALWVFRRDYARMDWRASWSAAALGVAAFALWMALEPRGPATREADSRFALGLAALGNPSAGLWLLARVVGSVVTVPIVEELAFRGFLTRRLISSDIDRVPAGRLTPTSFLLSSILFGLLHGRWVAGTGAGMLYAAAYGRRGRIGDAVLAHAVTNALIAAAALATGSWSLWC